MNTMNSAGVSPRPSVSAAEVAAIQRRTLTVVVISQVLGGAGLAAGITVGALLAQEMLGGAAVAGLPAAMFTLGSALTAYLVGRVTQRWGRRPGLGFGFAAGGVGAIGVVIAAGVGSVSLLFVSLFIYGAGTATNLQARYAGADLARPERRGTAVSVAMVSTTLGAVAGPNLVAPMGQLATGFGLPALSGPFILAAAAYLAAGAVLLAFLRPDPFLTARALDTARGLVADPTGVRVRPRPRPAAVVGAIVMVLSMISMAAIMTMTPVHMQLHHFGIAEIGLVIGLHIGAMYLPSLVTGVLVDRIGRIPMAVLAGVTLLAAGVVGALAPGNSLGLLILALVLLGLGWNFGVIAGTSLVVDGTVPQNRAQTQGKIDVLVALAGAGGGMMSGVVMAAGGFDTLALGGGVLALLLIPALFWARRGRR